MNPPVSATSLNQPFTGWDELRSPGTAWKIEKPQQRAETFVPFFPDQNGKVYERNLGKDSAAIGAKMTTFDPGPGWKEVR